ncbi:YXWGXW repeat-containing protein [Rhodocaloribacter litoris]|uniref:hypothetical protein n=1 Tax=Rhodocaloribacter litoris TaxID=2558931 RepID=UPI001E436954|nr:hypothetical protein [Rhodocaloribacter litoris]QXD15176.1 YXWGXW repeat-containing protein [Rhodocaloribacter litoris]
MQGKSMMPVWLTVVSALFVGACASAQPVAHHPHRVDRVVVVHAHPGPDHVVIVRKKPPKPRREKYRHRPSPRHVWIPGYWAWHRGRYVWKHGYWALPPRPGAVWVATHWAPYRDGWVFVAGYWR